MKFTNVDTDRIARTAFTETVRDYPSKAVGAAAARRALVKAGQDAVLHALARVVDEYSERGGPVEAEVLAGALATLRAEFHK